MRRVARDRAARLPSAGRRTHRSCSSQVNAISPGYIETDMMLAQVQRGQYSLDKVRARTPMPRLGKPADIGAMAAFLGSPGASWINGAVIPVDGGWMANGGPE